MKRVLIIGAGGVGSVVAQKCARASGFFSEICLASRTIEKCEAVAAVCDRRIVTRRVDADRTEEVVSLIKDFGADLVLHVALPYQDLSIMDACLETGVDYLDTANYEPRDKAEFRYGWQWDYHDRFRNSGIMALLGCGFDPGVTSIFVAHALKHHFDQIDEIEIIDVNAGDHGQAFATNFNPEINIREVTQRGKYYEDGEWLETDPLSIHRTYDVPEGIGPREVYLMYHEELESLARHIPGVKRIRFWMSFSESYLTHLRVLQNVGMTRIDAVEFGGQRIVPLQFLKAVLPEPGTLGNTTKGRTWIGCEIEGMKSGQRKYFRIYNSCDHEEAYRDVGAQGVSFTTGVPATIGAILMSTGVWRGEGVFNVEEFDPDPFMSKLPEFGLPWIEG
ncbi:MAG: saccharopine dehydrogenase family protein [Verrucomicrobiota bacterium]